MEEKIDQPAINQRYESIDYESTSIILNGDDVFTLLTQGFIMCSIVFALRACLFTLQANADRYDEELKALERREDPNQVE